MTNDSRQILYFVDEGKAHLNDTLDVSLKTAVDYGIEKLVIFTAQGEGIYLATKKLKKKHNIELKKRHGSNEIKLVGVSFPHGQTFADPNEPSKQIQVEIDPQYQRAFTKAKIPIIRAHLPFDPIAARFRDHGMLGQDFSLIGNALTMFGGGMSLCVQAALMACDAGAVTWGEHVIAMTADTSVLLQAAPTHRFLTDLVVREILCKPLFLTVAKREAVPPVLVQGVPYDDPRETSQDGSEIIVKTT